MYVFVHQDGNFSIMAHTKNGRKRPADLKRPGLPRHFPGKWGNYLYRQSDGDCWIGVKKDPPGVCGTGRWDMDKRSHSLK